VKPVLFRLHDDNPPGDGRQRLALPGQGLRLLWGIGVKNDAQRQALVSPVIERARHEGFVAQPCNRLRYKCRLGESEFFRFRRLDSELLTERCQSRQEAFSGVEKPCVAHGAPYPARPANELRIATDGF